VASLTPALFRREREQQAVSQFECLLVVESGHSAQCQIQEFCDVLSCSEGKWAERHRMAIKREEQNGWILGATIPGVSFRMQDAVKVISGPHAGVVGELISIYAIEPEPVYHLETHDGSDIHVRQSEIVCV
jgi:hypothetical protein